MRFALSTKLNIAIWNETFWFDTSGLRIWAGTLLVVLKNIRNIESDQHQLVLRKVIDIGLTVKSGRRFV